MADTSIIHQDGIEAGGSHKRIFSITERKAGVTRPTLSSSKQIGSAIFQRDSPPPPPPPPFPGMGIEGQGKRSPWLHACPRGKLMRVAIAVRQYGGRKVAR